MTSPLNTFNQADALLDVLDNAPVGTPGAFFRDDLGKQWMESCIIRAIGKLKGAEYHHTNIESEVQELRERAADAAKSLNEQNKSDNGTLGANAPYTMLSRGEQDEIAYELDAFLAAARSCIDFISGMLALHIKGMHRRTSITSLLKTATADPTGPFSGLLTKWREWIELLKEYRDECVHYRTIHMTGGTRSSRKAEMSLRRCSQF